MITFGSESKTACALFAASLSSNCFAIGQSLHRTPPTSCAGTPQFTHEIFSIFLKLKIKTFLKLKKPRVNFILRANFFSSRTTTARVSKMARKTAPRATRVSKFSGDFRAAKLRVPGAVLQK